MSLTDLPDNLIDLPKKQLKGIRKEIYNKYAQKPSQSARRFHNLDKNHSYSKFADRNEFSRDRDRILFSKAFRRLEHKAQVYSHEKGDHFRTRLTHTLEVVQIARSIGKNLGLNEDLIEAIALGHDVGHTPFGHAGEEVLDMIMRGNDDLGGKLIYKINYGGFKHNFHSLRILDIIERKYEKNKGLNLTWQVIEGILKHTKTKKGEKTWDVNRFMQYSKYIKPFMDDRFLDFSVTLEGQVVNIADEIAQRQHDLDDGLRDKDLNLRGTDIIDHIQEVIDEIIYTIGITNDRSFYSNKLNAKLRPYLYNFKQHKPFPSPKQVINNIIHGNFLINPNISFNSFKILNRTLKPSKKLLNYIFDLEMSKYSDTLLLLNELKDKIEKREEKKKFEEKELISKINDILKYSKKTKVSKDKIDLLDEIKSDLKNKKVVPDEYNLDYALTSLVRDITEFFILDVTVKSLKNIADMDKDAVEKNYNEWVRKEVWSNRRYFLKKIIDFSFAGKEMDNKLEKYINSQILNSYHVNRFDGKAYYTIRQIFKAYYSNPRQMPSELLDSLSKRIKMNSDWYGCKVRLDEYIDKINFREDSPKEINDLVKLLKLEMNKEELESVFDKTYPNIKVNFKLDEKFLGDIGYDMRKIKEKCKECNESTYERWLLVNIFKIVNEYRKKDIIKENNIEKRTKILFIKCLLEHHYSYMSIICDHIAGMTDNYAKNEYARLYLV